MSTWKFEWLQNWGNLDRENEVQASLITRQDQIDKPLQQAREAHMEDSQAVL